jgi:uncharacterized SAM-binding protein YcdF (DUF218 family)
VNGVTMVRREGLRLANLLSLLAGLATMAVIAFRLATPLAGAASGQLAPSAATVMLLFGYVSFQCLSFILYAFLYGRLPVPRAADFVVVLGSGLREGGRVPPPLASRLDRGQAVFRALAARGSDPVLIVSGGKGGDEQVSEAEAMAGYLAARGFPADRLQREDRSASTRENLACSRVIMDRLRPGPSCVIVTSNFHVFRAAMIARRLGVRGQVTGAHTARYYWPSATLREFAAVFLSYKAVNAAVCALLVAAPGRGGPAAPRRGRARALALPLELGDRAPSAVILAADATCSGTSSVADPPSRHISGITLIRQGPNLGSDQGRSRSTRGAAAGNLKA